MRLRRHRGCRRRHGALADGEAGDQVQGAQRQEQAVADDSSGRAGRRRPCRRPCRGCRAPARRWPWTTSTVAGFACAEPTRRACADRIGPSVQSGEDRWRRGYSVAAPGQATSANVRYVTYTGRRRASRTAADGLFPVLRNHLLGGPRLPSGSLKKTNQPHGCLSTSLASTPRPRSSSRSAAASSTTTWRPCLRAGRHLGDAGADHDRAGRARAA